MPPFRTTSHRKIHCVTIAALAAALFVTTAISAQSLSGSWASMNKQVTEASRHDYTYIQNPDQVRRFVDAGYIVPVRGNRDYYLKEVSYPYARKEVREFIELMAAHYREQCGEQLVVTSLTRPKNRQPRNASRRSVHPTGMAFDLRRSWNQKCRRTAEQILLRAEAYGVLDATLERKPYHYHVALFPRVFRERGEKIFSEEFLGDYFVVRGDTLSKIARLHRTSVDMVKAVNGLRGSTIYPGQRLKIPSAGR